MKEGEVDDATLVARAAKKDREAFRLLVERHQQRLFAVAFEMLKRREDAEDVVQESFVKAYLSLDRFQGKGSFFTWMYRIVFNMAIDQRRRSARDRSVPLEQPASPGGEARSIVASPEHGPEDHLARQQEVQLVQRGLREISEEHRAVIMLREVEGLSYDEIARSVGVSRGTVMSRLHYARKKLQQVLAAQLPHGALANGGGTLERDPRKACV